MVKKKTIHVIISISLIILSILMMTVFKDWLNKIDEEAFNFIAPLFMGFGLAHGIKYIWPSKKEK